MWSSEACGISAYLVSTKMWLHVCREVNVNVWYNWAPVFSVFLLYPDCIKSEYCLPIVAVLLDPHATLSDHLLHAVLLLLHKEVSDHGRHLPHYFSLFHMYASLGVPERTQLLKVSFRNISVTIWQCQNYNARHCQHGLIISILNG
jgi:hypothetical protein